MTTLTLQRSAVSLSVIAMLGACGGGGNGSDVASSTSAKREQAQALTVGSVGAKELFDWAQYKYPTLFAKGPQNQPLSYLGVDYTIRAYPNGNYLGLTTSGVVYGYGPFNNNVLTPYGTLAGYAAAVVADECLVTPTAAGCTNPPPSGPLNECIDPLFANPPTGFRLHLVYDLSGDGATGEQTSDSVVDGAATFEGQSATQTTTNFTSNINSPAIPVPVTSTGIFKNYTQPGSNGLAKNLGGNNQSTSGAISIGGITVPGSTTISKIVYTPPFENLEYTLTVGQSITYNTTQTITVTQPVSQQPVTSNYRRTYTFEARETISVLGRSYSTCRYLITDSAAVPSTSWLIVGKGVAAKTQTVSEGKTTLLQLKPGSTYNGAAL